MQVSRQTLYIFIYIFFFFVYVCFMITVENQIIHFRLYNVSLQCVVNSTRNKGYNCSSAYMNKWAIPVISQYVKSMNTSLTRIDSSVAFDADTCPGKICD
ncbi:hypothetical protein CI610_03339 [invertebrate metagenome]|uniref:Uncharacterized protein n=1 Tax=invertebrate metagenome TaxID=1711999 RepID=A0A2H9T3D2_9ZZZZ